MESFVSSWLVTPLVIVFSSLLVVFILGGGRVGLGEPEEQVPLSELLEALQQLVEQQQQQRDEEETTTNDHEEEEEALQQQQLKQQHQQQYDIMWRRIRRRLQQVPEEAACYCHTVDPSPLLECLTKTPLSINIPLSVIQAFLEAYEDAVYTTDGHTNTTPLMAAIQRAGILKKKKTKKSSAVVPTNQREDQQEDLGDAAATSSISEEEDKIIELLLQANPFAAQQTDKQGRLPLHFVRSLSLTTAQKVLNASGPNPSAGLHQQDHEGRLPLHYYCQLFEEPKQQQREAETQNDDSRIGNDALLALTIPNVDILKLFLSAMGNNSTATTSPPVLIKDGSGRTPLDIFFKSYEKILLSFQQQQQQHKSTKCSSSRQEENAVTVQMVDQLWEILTLLIHSATTATGTTTTAAALNLPIVHALVSLRCPATIVREALRRFPNQAVERDEQGRTPLLLAVSLLEDSAATATPPAPAATTTTTRPINNNNKKNNNNSHHQHDTNNTQQVIAILLETNQRAARMTDKEGRLAIDVLSEKQYYNDELYDLLVRAEPRALCTRDLKNKQHPFLTAAMAGNQNGVYHLLRAKPHVIRYFLNEC